MPEPNVTIRAARSSDGSNLPPRRVVIHATCGRRGYPRESAAGVAKSTANYFKSASAKGSAHYVCDIGGEEHTLPDSRIAWHAPPNARSLGIEICADGGEAYKGFVPYTREQWLSPQVWPAVLRAARRTAELCARHGIPARRLTVAQVKAGLEGICGHVDVSKAFGQTDHSDPGPTFPWTAFMAAVRGENQQEEDAVIVVSVGAGSDQQAPAKGERAVVFAKEWADKHGAHPTASSGILAPKNDLWALCDALVTVTGLKAGHCIDVAWSRYSRDGETFLNDGWRLTYRADEDGRVKVGHGGQFGLDTATLLRLRVINPNDYPVTISGGTQAKVTLVKNE